MKYLDVHLGPNLPTASNNNNLKHMPNNLILGFASTINMNNAFFDSCHYVYYKFITLFLKTKLPGD